MTDTGNEAPEQPEEIGLLDRLMQPGPASDDPTERVLAAWLTAVQASPSSPELSGLNDALAAFNAHKAATLSVAGPSGPKPLPSRHSRRTIRRSSKVAIGATVGVVLLGGTAAAAFDGALPAPLQRLVHQITGLPGPRRTDPTATPTSPAGTGTSPSPTATDARTLEINGLCAAYVRGVLAPSSPGFRTLLSAAGATQSIATYCRAHPKATDTGATHPPAEATTGPSGHPSTQPSGPPTSHPSGEPSSHPAGGPRATQPDPQPPNRQETDSPPTSPSVVSADEDRRLGARG